MHYDFLDSPLGPILLACDDKGLTHIDLPHEAQPTRVAPDWQRSPARLRAAHRQLDAYFGGRLTTFELPLNPHGTDFQRAVWDELTRIPYGDTISYGELARRLGDPRASRAVGSANGANPLAIVVPCHRVIGADGSLTGYGGGLAAKEFLLALERRNAPPVILRLTP